MPIYTATDTNHEPAYGVSIAAQGFYIVRQGANREWFPLVVARLRERLPDELHPRRGGFYSSRALACAAADALAVQVVDRMIDTTRKQDDAIERAALRFGCVKVTPPAEEDAPIVVVPYPQHLRGLAAADRYTVHPAGAVSHRIERS